MTTININKTYPTNKYGDVLVVEKLPKSYYTVKFINTGYECVVRSSDLKKGLVKDYMAPTVQGVGYHGVGPHKATEMVGGKRVKTRMYTLWTNMFRRCYDEKALTTHPSYIGCSVDLEWHCFQDFCETIKEVPGYLEWLSNSNFALDKDGIVDGNKVYSKHTCQFITDSENSTIANHRRYYK